MRTCICGINHFRPVETHPKKDAWKCGCSRWVYPSHIVKVIGDDYDAHAIDSSGNSVCSTGFRAYIPHKFGDTK